MRLAGRIAIVTGAGSHIGRAIALGYAREGATVVCAGRTLSKLEETVARIKEGHDKGIAMVCDVSQWSQVSALAEQTLAEFGRIDILVNNAASWGERRPIWELDPERWSEDIGVSLGGTFFCTRAVLPHMVARDSGKIITLSGNGSFGTPPPPGDIGSSAYVTSKCAICRFTEHLAAQLEGHNIQVNSLGPGYTPTPEMRALHLAQVEETEKRTGRPHWMRSARSHEPDEAAELAVFLASDESETLTGRHMTVDDDYRSLAGQPLTRDAYRIIRVTE